MAIMLSYSRKDEGVVKALARDLEAAKRQVWFDHNLVGGDAWWDAILENIRSANAFIFALSDASLQSKPCRLELDYAFDLGRPIVPVRVGAVTSLRASPLAQLQIIDYSPDRPRSGFGVLAAVDDAAMRERPLPDPLPPPPPIPFAYLLAIGRQIESAELRLTEQLAAVDQLRRALGEETDESVRRDIVSMLKNLNSKPWTARRTEREVTALLIAYVSEFRSEDGHEGWATTRHAERPDAAAPADQPPAESAAAGPAPAHAAPADQAADHVAPADRVPVESAVAGSAHGTPTDQAAGQVAPADRVPAESAVAGSAQRTPADQGSDHPAATDQAPAQSPPADPPSAHRTETPGPASPRPPDPGPDPHEWFAERLEQLPECAADGEEAAVADPPTWRPTPDAADRWSRTFEQEPPAWPGAATHFAGPPGPDPAASFPGVTPQHPPPRSAPQPNVQPPPAASWTPPATPPNGPPPPDHRALIRASSVLPPWLFGLIARRFSREAGQRYLAGDLVGAHRASRNAAAWGIVGLAVGLVLLIVLATL